MKGLNISKWSAGKLSHTVLYAITALTVLVFLLFYSVGYNMPSMWNENVNSPLFTDLVLVLMILMLLSAVAVTLYSKLRSVKTVHTEAVVNGINGKKITYGVMILVVFIMSLSFLLLPVDTGNIIGGQVFTDAIWLRMANMFVFTCVALMLIGFFVIVYASIKNRRLRK